MKLYYYNNAKGQQIGPVDLETLKNSGITPTTLVWCEGMPQWAEAKDVPEVCAFFSAPGGHPTPPPINNNWNQPNPGNWNQNNNSGNNVNWGNNNVNQNNYIEKPQNYLWLAIGTTLLCCLPCGIVSIVFASKVDSAWNQGNYAGAKEYSDKAKMWGLISAGIGVVAGFFSFLIALFA